MEEVDEKMEGYLHPCELGEVGELIYMCLDQSTLSFVGLEASQ